MMGLEAFKDSTDCMRDCNNSCGLKFWCNIECEWKCIRSASIDSLKFTARIPGPSPSPQPEVLEKMEELSMNL
ncbi:hypothetical protein V6N13_049070 [Hibiscus sabdariffa]